MMEIITESKREEYYKRQYIDIPKFKNQRLKGALTGGLFAFLVGVVLLFIRGVNIATIIGIVLLIMTGAYIGWKNWYVKLKKANEQQDARLGLMFPEFLQTFLALIETSPNTSIVTIFEQTVPYLENPIDKQVLKMVDDIYKDGTDTGVRKAMLNFGEYINTVEARRIMDLIFSMYIEGVDTTMLKDLSSTTDELNRKRAEIIIEFKSRKLRGKSVPTLFLAMFFIFGYVGMVGFEYLLNALQFI